MMSHLSLRPWHLCKTRVLGHPGPALASIKPKEKLLAADAWDFWPVHPRYLSIGSDFWCEHWCISAFVTKLWHLWSSGESATVANRMIISGNREVQIFSVVGYPVDKSASSVFISPHPWINHYWAWMNHTYYHHLTSFLFFSPLLTVSSLNIAWCLININ